MGILSPPDRASDPPTVLVTWPDYDVDAADLGGALQSAGYRIHLAPRLRDRSPSELAGLARDAVGAIVSTDPFDRSVLEACPQLRVIARVGVGSDSIDLTSATAQGVAVTTTPGANEATVADHTLAMMLAVVRRVCEHDAAVRRGEWPRTGAHTPRLLSGSTVGLLGFGRIGRQVAARLAGFDVRLLVADPAVAADADGVQAVDRATLLRRADVVSLHLPLTEATQGLIGAAELATMRPDAILVNTARGGLVDEAALLAALDAGALAGAALDVFEREPPGASGLLGHPRVVLSPHNAGLSDLSVQEMTRRATASVIDVLGGRRPVDLANPDVLRSAAPTPEGDDRA